MSDVEIVAKLAPANDAFTGLIDANQIIGDAASNVIPASGISSLSVTQHEGDLTINEANLDVNAPTNDFILTADSGESGGMKWAAGGNGTVTSIVAGSGLDFTTITGAGSITLGTPGTTTSSSTNNVTATSHTHQLDETGISITASQVSDFDTEVSNNGSVVANTAKVTNATHTGDVTGDVNLIIANDAVTNSKAANMATTTIKGRVSGGTGDAEDLTPSQARTVLDFDVEVSNNTDVAANTSKETNVTTNLTLGTVTSTTIDVNSSDGTNATLVEANTTNAGILGSDKWDEIAANTSASHAESHTIVSHNDTTATGGELNTLTGGGDTTLHDHDGISENTTHRSSDGKNHSDVVTNNSKVSNATHTGEVTGDTALTIADNIIDEANLKLDEGPTNDFVLTADSTKSGGMKWVASAGGASPLTTKGDLYGFSTVDARIPVGTNGQVLESDSTETTGLKWTDTATGFSYFILWAEENAATGAGNFEWAWGNGDDAPTGSGAVIGVDAELYAIGTTSTASDTSLRVSVNKNEVLAGTSDTLTGKSELTTLGSPVSFVAGDVLDFQTHTAGSSTGGARVFAFFRVPFTGLKGADGATGPAGANGEVATSGTPVTADYAKFTDATTIEGRSFSEVKTDLSLNNVTNDAQLPIAGGTMTGALIARDHGTATVDEVINAVYGTSATPPTASTTTEGTVYFQYTA